MKISHIALAALALATFTGCVDNAPIGSVGSTTDVRRQGVTAVPEFVVTGTDTVPDSLFLTKLGLTVSEIRLEPMWSTDSLAYSTRNSMPIQFDLEDGQTIQTDEALELPTAGRYLVSIRLEPSAAAEGEEPASFRLDGFVAGQQERVVDSNMDGWPQPMPFDENQNDGELSDSPEYPVEWTPFEYHSKRAVFFTFNDVELQAGEQFLTFSFDVRDWAVDVAEPISNAVETSQRWNDDSVDVTNQVDSTGTGVEALIRTGVVRSDRRP